MSATQVPVDEGTRFLEELLAVHGVMTRGAELVAGAFTRLAGGAAVDTKTLVTTVRWLTGLVRHHLDREDEALHPVPKPPPPELVHGLDWPMGERDWLAGRLDDLEDVVLRIAEERRVGGSAEWGRAMRGGTLASYGIRDELARHFGTEEPRLRDRLAAPLDENVAQLRQAVTDRLPCGAPHLVFGFLEYPAPLPGRDQVYVHFSASVRLARGMLLSRFRRTLRDLAAD
ncbi:hemerythrin domain-containing protein [Streptomyces sp. NPDC096057]|uniref:hemerythrin domain-containing protein n=1 Tax=Streptomyces sp. NPDC096057 TaxID=3155543 RepID=UPI0033183566